MEPGSGPNQSQGQSGITQAALFGRCPRCGAKTLFEAPAQFAITCSSCDLPFAELEGRGGRFVGMFTAIVAIILIMLATGLDMWLQPPFWLQIALWPAVTVAAVLGSLRLFKTIPLLANYERQFGTDAGSRSGDGDA